MSSIRYITLEEALEDNPELKLSDIQILRDWCVKQPHLPKIDDGQLVTFLHSRKYRIESTKNRIENYFTIRTHVPEFFSNRNILNEKEFRDAYNILSFLFLNDKTKEGYNIVVHRFQNFDFSHFVHNDSMKAILAVHDEYIWTHGITPGYTYLFDATGISLAFVARLNIVGMRKLIIYIQEALPIRLKSIHIINASPVVDMILNMVKPLIKQKILKRIHFHSTLESLGEYIPIDALPNELGGKAGELTKLHDAQVKKIENFREWFSEDERINRVNESLRIGKSKTSSDLFGMDGSFKQLEID